MAVRCSEEMLGTPNSGTYFWIFNGWTKQARQMKPNSIFLRNLNNGNKTPFVGKWFTYSGKMLVLDNDGVIPVNSVQLKGATNYGPYDNVYHDKLFTAEKVHVQVLADLI